MKENNQIKSIIYEILGLDSIESKEVQKVFRKYPKNNKGLYKQSDVLIYYKSNKDKLNLSSAEQEKLYKALKLKKIRTISGVTPVTVLTKPFPCPGQCIFCPNDVRMPKSYLSDEPGAQRAFKNKFDPYQQTYNRLVAYNQIGHPTDKIELIILGGTFTAYPLPYQIWFVKRCFDAMNDFKKETSLETIDLNTEFPFNEEKLKEIKGENYQDTYNKIVSLALNSTKKETATFEELFKAHSQNETAEARCVGLVLETRPDEINEETVINMRKLGATKIQLGIQSLDDNILQANKRGHSVDDNAKAMALLRQAGFKIHIHWMPNLYKSTPEKDICDYKKLFDDDRFKPDEIKIYPCSLIESAELMKYYKKGLWKPYTNSELLKVLTESIKYTPQYCRITRVIRDISSNDIVVGNKKTNFRQIAENTLKAQNIKINEIRSREIKDQKVSKDELKLDIVKYSTTVSTEYFLQYVTKENETPRAKARGFLSPITTVDQLYPRTKVRGFKLGDNKIAGFLRLSIPKNLNDHFIDELKGASIIREVHVYGPSIEIGKHKPGKPQHLGLGSQLIEKAIDITKSKNISKIAVISSIGTRKYYEKFGFKLQNLYQVLNLKN